MDTRTNEDSAVHEQGLHISGEASFGGDPKIETNSAKEINQEDCMKNKLKEPEDCGSVNVPLCGKTNEDLIENIGSTSGIQPSSVEGFTVNLPLETSFSSQSRCHRLAPPEKTNCQINKSGLEIITKEVSQPQGKKVYDISSQRAQSNALQISMREELPNLGESAVSDCNPIILSVRGNATDEDLTVVSESNQSLVKDAIQFLKDTDCISASEKEKTMQKTAQDTPISISKPSCGNISEKESIACSSNSSTCDVPPAGNLVLDNNECDFQINPELSMPASSILLTMVSKASADKPNDSLAAISLSRSIGKVTRGRKRRAQTKMLTSLNTSKSLAGSIVRVGQSCASSKLVNILPASCSNGSSSFEMSCGFNTTKKSEKRPTAVSLGVSKPTVKIVLTGPQNMQLPKTVTIASTSGVCNTLNNRVTIIDTMKDKSSSSNAPNNAVNSSLNHKAALENMSEKMGHLSSVQAGLSFQEALKTSLLKPLKKGRENLEKLFVCLVCGDEFYQQEFLQHHMERKVFVVDYHCEGCKKNMTFYNKCKFWLHVRNEKIVNPYLDSEISHFNLKPYCDLVEEGEDPSEIKCKFCYEGYSPEDFKKHFSIITPSAPPFFCHRCLMSLANKCALLAHQKIHEAGSKDVTCPECGETFTSTDGLKVLFDHLDSCYHFNFHCVFPCHCGELFKSFLALEYHLLKSHAKILFRCNKCQKCFSSSQQFYLHGKVAHNAYYSPSIIVYCDLCNLGFEDALRLQLHLGEHVKEQSLLRKKVLHCSLCTDSFSTPSLLNSHIEKSHSHRPKRCTICFGLFEGRQNLVQHIVSKKCSPVSLPKKFHKCIDVPTQQEDTAVSFNSYKKLFDSPVSKSNPKVLTGVPVKQLLDKAKPQGTLVSFKDSVEQPKDNRKFQCHTCKICLVGSKNFEKHVGLHKSYGLIRNQTHCGICKKSIDDSLIQAHMENHQKRGIIVCSLCHSRNFDTMHDALQHSVNLCYYKEVENDGAAFVKSNEYSNVISDNTIEINEEEGENNQEKTSSEESSVFPCLMCGLTFSSKQAKDDHVSRIHDGTRTLYFCLLCKKKGLSKHFTKRNMITKHISHKHRVANPSEISKFIHVEEQNVSSGHVVPTEPNNENNDAPPPKQLRLATEGDYVCGKCGFSMGDSRLFAEHITTHNPRKEPQCPECGLCFTVLPALKKHLFMVHKIKGMDEYLEKKGMIETAQEEDEEEEYDDHLNVCSIEVSSEPDSSSAKEAGGLGEKRSRFCDGSSFECNVCYRGFSTETALKSHMRNHGMAFIRSRRHEKPSS